MIRKSKQNGGATRAKAGESLDGRMQRFLMSVRGKRKGEATEYDQWVCACLALREIALEERGGRMAPDGDEKTVHYLSMEFLIGRLLKNNLLAMGFAADVGQAAGWPCADRERLAEVEPDAGLGNGGLGRLAACYLDSLATLGYAAYGHGLRYEHGMFRQEFDDGWQVERPDDWLRLGTPWEIVRPEDTVSVLAYGRTVPVAGAGKSAQAVWMDWQMIEGVPFDVPVMGWDGGRINALRLWSSRAAQGFRLDVFNQGDYVRAVEEKNWAETITKVLYPSDGTGAGRELRLLQEYFLVACAIRDLTRAFRRSGRDWRRLPQSAAVQMNDTHPALAVAELMRVLVDEEELPWETAWDVATRTLAYTNHTLMPEALERWPVPLFDRVLPRHLEIVYEINARFLRHVAELHPGDTDRLRRMSLIEEGDVKQVRMAHLAVVGSHAVNGVARLHSDLVRTRLLSDFAQLWPERFMNVTNGVTHRRWIRQCNPELAACLSARIGDCWLRDAAALRQLEAHVDDPGFLDELRGIKRRNKDRLAARIRGGLGVSVDPDSLFDVQVKRLHEYKRQLLNVLHILALYLRLRDGVETDPVPRTFVFGAKAAPSYSAAKHIIKLINNIGRLLETDRRVRDRLRVVFLPDYNVSLAECIIPAADLSEQISTAGTEASGTGNMKLALNGALTIGTWDGANIEIAEAVGLDNFFVFGNRVEDLDALRAAYDPAVWMAGDPELAAVLDLLRGDALCPGCAGLFEGLRAALTGRDYFFHLADFRSYVEAQRRVSDLYRAPAAWSRSAALNIARMGRFSSDRAVEEYAQTIWRLRPGRVAKQGVGV
jgi:starch phosphorylase